MWIRETPKCVLRIGQLTHGTWEVSTGHGRYPRDMGGAHGTWEVPTGRRFDGGGTDLAVEAQQQQHDEEEDGPEGRHRHHGHGFGVGDEGQTGTWREDTAGTGGRRGGGRD